jgi:small subunit ribosomal protein S20
MPQHKSAEKRIKTSAKERNHNRAVKGQIRRVMQEARSALGTDKQEEELREAASVLDKAAKKGVIPKRRASRRKARLAKAAFKATNAKKS